MSLAIIGIESTACRQDENDRKNDKCSGSLTYTVMKTGGQTQYREWLPELPVALGNYISLFQQVPGIPSKGLLFFLSTILLRFFAYAVVMMLGYLITTMYYRMSKSLKLIVSIGVPGFLFVLLPIIDFSLFKGAIYSVLRQMPTVSFGNFRMIMVSCIILYAVFAALSWLLVKKVVVKD